MNEHQCIVLMSGAMLLLFVAWGSVPACAQETDSVRQRALEAFHGPDGQGKDGPLAPVGFDLALLYAEWQAHQDRGTASPFSPRGSFPVRDGRITIDATAAQDATALRDSLEALGLTNSAQAGRIVSGRLPIASIPAAAALANLRAMRPARAMTNRPSVPSTIPAGSRTDTSGAGADTAATAGDTGRSESGSAEASQSMYWIGGVVILIVGLFFFLLRRDA